MDIQTTVGTFHHLAKGIAVFTIIQAAQPAIAKIAASIDHVVIGSCRLIGNDAGSTALGLCGSLAAAWLELAVAHSLLYQRLLLAGNLRNLAAKLADSLIVEVCHFQHRTLRSFCQRHFVHLLRSGQRFCFCLGYGSRHNQ